MDVHIHIHDSSKIVYDLTVADSPGLKAMQEHFFCTKIELRQWNYFIIKEKYDTDIKFDVEIL